MDTNNKKTIALIASKKQRELHSRFIDDLSASFHMVTQDYLKQNQDECLDIVLLGGDGSLNYLVNNFDIGQKSILYFPTGTANDFAKSLRITPTIPSLNKLHSILQQNRKSRIPLMSCNDQKFINVASAGAPARVTDSGNNLLKNFIGKASYYISSIDKLLSNEQYHLKLTSPETQETKELTTKGFVISQGIYAGGGVRVTTNYCANFESTFNFVSPSSIDIQEIISCMVKLQNIDIDTSELELVSLNYNQLNIECDQTIPLKLDGEEYSAKKLLFKKENTEVFFYQH